MKIKRTGSLLGTLLLLGSNLILFQNCTDIGLQKITQDSKLKKIPRVIDDNIPQDPVPGPNPPGDSNPPPITCEEQRRTGESCFDTPGIGGAEVGVMNLSPDVCNAEMHFKNIDYFPSPTAGQGFYTIDGNTCKFGGQQQGTGGISVLFDSGKIVLKHPRLEIGVPYAGPDGLTTHIGAVSMIPSAPSRFLLSSDFPFLAHSSVSTYEASQGSLNNTSIMVPTLGLEREEILSLTKNYHAVTVGNKIISLVAKPSGNSLVSSNEIRNLESESIGSIAADDLRVGDPVVPLFSFGNYFVGIDILDSLKGSWNVYSLQNDQVEIRSTLFERPMLSTGAMPAINSANWRTFDRDGRSDRFLIWNNETREASVFEGKADGTMEHKYTFNFSGQLPSRLGSTVMGSISGEYVALVVAYNNNGAGIKIFKNGQLFKSIPFKTGVVSEGPNFNESHRMWLGGDCIPHAKLPPFNDSLICDHTKEGNIPRILDVELTPFGDLLFSLYQPTGMYRVNIFK